MKNIKQKKITKVIKIMIFAVILIACTKTIYAVDNKIESFNVDATLMNNGDLTVVEMLKSGYEIEEPFIRKIPKKLIDSYENIELEKNRNALYKQYDFKEIINIKVSEVGNNGNVYEYSDSNILNQNNLGTYSFNNSNDNNYIELKITPRDKNSSKSTYKIEYIIQNVAIKYSDISEIYWNFFGEGFKQGINNVDIKIHFPQNIIKENLKYYLHGANAKDYRIEEKNTVRYSTKNFKENKYVTSRIIFPNEQINFSNNLEYFVVKNDINEIESTIPLDIKNNKTYFDIGAVIQIILIIALTAYFIILFVIYEKDELIPIASVDEFKMFDEYNPLIAGCILQDRDVQPRDIVATLLNLVNKKVLKIEMKKKLDDSYIYEISKNTSLEIYKMDDIETYIYDWFFIEDETIELVSRLKSFSKSDDTMFKLYRLQQVATKKLDKMGASKKKVPKTIKKINNIIFIVVIIFVFLNIIEIMFVNPTISIEKNSKMNTETYKTIVYVVTLLLPIVMMIAVYIAQLIVYIKAGIRKVIKIPFNNFAKFMIPYSIISVILIILDIIFLNNLKFTLDMILIMLTTAIMLSDNLMSKHEKSMLKVASRLNVIKNKIENSLIKEKDIGHILIWDRYITYGISLGVSDRILKRVPDIANIQLFEIDIMKKNLKKVLKAFYTKRLD